MKGELIFLAVYLLTECLNYLFVYVMIFQADITRNVKQWVTALGIVLTIHGILLLWKGAIISSSVSFVSMIVIPIFLLEIRQRKYFVLYPFVVMTTAVFDVSLSFLLAIFLDIPEVEAIDDYVILLICQSIPAFVLFLIYLHTKRKAHQKIHIQLGKTQYVLFYVGVICTYLMLASMQMISGGERSDRTINVCGFSISIACIVFLILILWQGIVVYREIQEKEQNRMYERYMEQQEEHFRQILEQDEKMRRFRHDMNAHMAVLKAYSNSGNNQELERYLQNVMEHSAIYEVKYYTGNKGVDAVVGQLFQEAKERAIPIDVNGAIPCDTHVSVYDLCTILSNLLKNAIEASEKIEDVTMRRIILEMGSYNEQLFLIVKNRVEEKVIVKNNKLISTKPDRENHGIGSQNVFNTVQKYEGDVQYCCEDGWFMAEIIL